VGQIRDDRGSVEPVKFILTECQFRVAEFCSI